MYFLLFRDLVTEFLLTLIPYSSSFCKSILRFMYNLSFRITLLFRKYHLEFYIFLRSRFIAYCASFPEFYKDSIYCCSRHAFNFLAANFCFKRISYNKWFSQASNFFHLNLKEFWVLGFYQHLDLIEHQNNYSLPLHEYHCDWTQTMIHQKILISFPPQFYSSSGFLTDCNCRFHFHALISDLLN